MAVTGKNVHHLRKRTLKPREVLLQTHGMITTLLTRVWTPGALTHCCVKAKWYSPTGE